MKKDYLIILLFLFSTNVLYAQISTYDDYDNVDYVGQVEDMQPYEIKSYNTWKNEGLSDTIGLAYINAGRALTNLEIAPATIVDFNFDMQEAGNITMYICLINSTPKTIADIKLTFEFLNEYGENVYDINSGKRHLTLNFHNLKGRTSSNKYSDIFNTLLDCYHILRSSDSSGDTSFVNKKVRSVRLESASIVYKDGTKSTKVAFFQGKNLLEEGPLKPIVAYLKRIEENK